MQIEAAAVGTEEQTNVEAQVDPAAAALAAAAANAPASTEDALRAKAAEAAKAEAPARPEWLPEGFETPEDLAKAYDALKLGKEAATDEAEVEPEAKTEEEPKELPAGFVDVKAVSAEWDEKGELSEATYADLAAKGYDKTIVDQYIAGQTALADAATRRLNEAAGGKENLERMFAWASTSLTAEQIGTYNASFANADVNAAALAIADLKSKYEGANGREPKLLGGKPPGSAADSYASWAEVTKAMSDPRYRSDPAYVAKVQAKLTRSNI